MAGLDEIDGFVLLEDAGPATDGLAGESGNGTNLSDAEKDDLLEYLKLP